ncbi:MAG: glycosyltransferase family 39 protein [Caldilineaceae bacterium]
MKTATRYPPLATCRWNYHWFIALALVFLLSIALWLRWRYVQDISLYVDEFTTLWAARRVQQIGAPIMPSGVLYTRGLLASYIEAAFLTLFGFNYTVGRLPSVLFGLASILASFFIGRRLWNVRVGWLAALGLALLPEAIIWSSRARFYAQLQFFALLLVWAAFEGIRPHPPAPSPDLKSQIRRGGVRGGEALFALLFVLALFSQEETILLYPALLLGWVLWRGWRDLFRLPVLLTHGVCVAAMGLRLVIETLGQPGYLETIQAQRPYVGLIFDVRGAWTTYGPLLIAPERLIWTLGGLLAMAVALVALRNGRWQLSALPCAQQATLFFVLPFLFVLLVILTLVGTSWREARYLLFIQPFWFLTGAAGIVWLIDQLVVTTLVVVLRKTTKVVTTNVALLTTILLTSLLFAVSFKPALAVLNQQVEGYDRALGYLAVARKSPPDANEVVMSPQPPACALVLGSCAYYAVQRDYAEFVIRRNGVLIDRWTGSTLLNSATQLQAVLQRDPQPPAPTWFVTDSFRLATRYEPDFVRMVIEQFDLVHQERGVMLLRAGAWRTLPKPVATKQLAQPRLFTPLALTGWERGDAKPGADLPLTLFWKATQTIAQQFNTSVRLVAADGKILAQQDGPPARGFIPTNLFFDTPVPDLKTLKIPATLASGRYRLEVSVYDVMTLTPLTKPQPFDWFTVGPSPAAPQQKIDAVWAKQIHLIGADTISPTLHTGQTLNVRLVWSASAPVEQNYTIFVHLVGADGKPIAQSDRAPEGGFYPTSGWQVGERVQDNYLLTVPETAPPGQYQLLVGLYRPETGERLLLNNQQDAITLATFMLVAK